MASPLAGHISDKIGRIWVIVAGTIATAFAIALIGSTSNIPRLFLLSAVFGIGEAVVTTVSAAHAAELSGPQTRGAAMGLYGSIMDTGYLQALYLQGC